MSTTASIYQTEQILLSSSFLFHYNSSIVFVHSCSQWIVKPVRQHSLMHSKRSTCSSGSGAIRVVCNLWAVINRIKSPSVHDSCLGLWAENLTRSTVRVVLGVLVHSCLNSRMSLEWHNAFYTYRSSTGQSRLFIKLGEEERRALCNTGWGKAQTRQTGSHQQSTA